MRCGAVAAYSPTEAFQVAVRKRRRRRRHRNHDMDRSRDLGMERLLHRAQRQIAYQPRPQTVEKRTKKTSDVEPTRGASPLSSPQRRGAATALRLAAYRAARHGVVSGAASTATDAAPARPSPSRARGTDLGPGAGPTPRPYRRRIARSHRRVALRRVASRRVAQLFIRYARLLLFSVRLFHHFFVFPFSVLFFFLPLLSRYRYFFSVFVFVFRLAGFRRKPSTRLGPIVTNGHRTYVISRDTTSSFHKYPHREFLHLYSFTYSFPRMEAMCVCVGESGISTSQLLITGNEIHRKYVKCGVKI